MTGPRLEAPEAVDPAGPHPSVELGPFFGKEAAGVAVVPRACQVDLAVGRVEVAQDQHAVAAPPKALESFEDRAVEIELVGNATVVAVVPAALREIGVDQREPSESRDLQSTLVVEALDPQRGFHSVRLPAREEPDAAVAPPLGAREVGVPTLGRAQVGGQIPGQGPHLLEPDDLGAGAAQPGPKAFAGAGAKAVHVPGEDPNCPGARHGESGIRGSRSYWT